MSSVHHHVLSWLAGRGRPAAQPAAQQQRSREVARQRLLVPPRVADVQRALLDALPLPAIVTLLADHTLLYANARGWRWLDDRAGDGPDLWSRVLDAPARDCFLAQATGADGVDGLAVQWRGCAMPSALRLSARRFAFGRKPALLTTLLVADDPAATGDDARPALRASLPGAAERGELRLRWQPRIDAHSGRATSVEALVEWQHPTLGRLDAGRWAADAPAADADTAVDPAFAWALAEACAAQRRWRDAGLPPAAVALRVPAQQALDAGFAAAVERMVAGTPPGAVELELAEPALTGASKPAWDALRRLKAAGCVLSVGCFGTGRLSLEALHGLPIDALRIDASLVRDLGDADTEGAAMARAIVALGRALGLRVGAHGVDRPAQEALLLAVGCDELQGALYGEPMGGDACAAWLRTHDDARTAAVLVS